MTARPTAPEDVADLELGGRATDRGATWCVLQVVASNALALYGRLGFTEHHRSHYRLAANPARLAAGDVGGAGR